MTVNDASRPYEYLGEKRYDIVTPEEYGAAPEGTRLKFDGVIVGKPVIKHLSSKFLVRYRITTHLTVSGIEVKYEGPALLRRGENVTVWGKKRWERFDAVRIETDDIIIQIS